MQDFLDRRFDAAFADYTTAMAAAYETTAPDEVPSFLDRAERAYEQMKHISTGKKRFLLRLPGL